MPRTELTRTKFFAISMAKEVLEDALPPLIIEGVKIVSQKRVTIRVPEEPEKDGFRIVLRFAAIEIPESVRIEAVVTCTMATTWVDGLHPESTSCIFSGRKLPGLVEAAYDYYKIGRIRGDLWTPSCRFRMYG